MQHTKPKARPLVSQSHTDVCMNEVNLGLLLTSSVLITQLQQFSEGKCALSSPFLPPGSMQAAD